MHKRIDFIDMVKQNKGNPQCRRLLDNMYEYYKLLDIDTGGNNGEIFNALYNEDHETYDEITEMYFVSIDTINRCRIRFNRLAIKLANKELTNNFNLAKTAR